MAPQISIYGYAGGELPELVASSDKVSVWSKPQIKRTNFVESISKNIYNDLRDIGWTKSDVTFLLNEAAQSILVGYPSGSPIIYLDITKFQYLPIICVGLIRRIYHKQVSLSGIVFDKTSRKIFVKLQSLKATESQRVTLSSKVGMTKLFEYLNEQNIRYSVLRFFSKLPNLHNVDGDFDILVCSSQREILLQFLNRNPGDIPVDVWDSVVPSYNGISYYPLKLADLILESSSTNSCLGNAKLPSDEVAFLSFAYHIVFHKGIESGVTNTLVEDSDIKNNKYIDEFNRLSNLIGANVDCSLECIAQYLEEHNWVPQKDTIFKISRWNVWVREVYLQKVTNTSACMYVVIIKKHGVLSKNINVIEKIVKQNSYQIIESGKFDEKLSKELAMVLRGGVWNEHCSSSERSEFFPAFYFLIRDPFKRVDGIQKLKAKIRLRVDCKPPSIIHTTDDSFETAEYLSEIKGISVERAIELVKIDDGGVTGKGLTHCFFVINCSISNLRARLFSKFVNMLTRV